MFSPQLVPLLGEVVEGLDGELSHLGNTPLEVILGPQSCLLSLLCVLLQQASTTWMFRPAHTAKQICYLNSLKL